MTGRIPDHVTISFLDGGTRIVPVHQVTCEADNRCEAVIVKDAGDDPDITHKARIGARVTLVPGSGSRSSSRAAKVWAGSPNRGWSWLWENRPSIRGPER